MGGGARLRITCRIKLKAPLAVNPSPFAPAGRDRRALGCRVSYFSWRPWRSWQVDTHPHPTASFPSVFFLPVFVVFSVRVSLSRSLSLSSFISFRPRLVSAPLKQAADMLVLHPLVPSSGRLATQRPTRCMLECGPTWPPPCSSSRSNNSHLSGTVSTAYSPPETGEGSKFKLVEGHGEHGRWEELKPNLPALSEK